MKRIGNLFSKITESDNIRLGFQLARKGKRWQDTIKIFEMRVEENIERIRMSLIDKTFTTSKYETFVIYEPKRRVIYKLPFDPDRIVQHALMNIIEPIWESFFIDDSYACRKGKGIHAGSRRTMEFIRKVGKNGYCLKMDVSKFYPSIKHDILFDLIKHKIKCKDTLELFRDIVYSVPDGYNVPVGNYTSQWLGNLYLNELDQFVKQKLKCKMYIRYCDDFIIFHTNKTYLQDAANDVTSFLSSELDLKLSKKRIFPITQGVDFLGYRHFRDHILLRKCSATRIKRRLKILPDIFDRSVINKDQLRSSLASTAGWLMWCNSFNFVKSLNLPKLEDLCHV
ncbi:MAG: reverse transcriptase/maturase family protein [Euryarchaeota archaeon]|nr:reverse transcriptase/maturase family protein [Euryarchaeota archaeon]